MGVTERLWLKVQFGDLPADILEAILRKKVSLPQCIECAANSWKRSCEGKPWVIESMDRVINHLDEAALYVAGIIGLT